MLKSVLNCIASDRDRKFGNHATFFSRDNGNQIQNFTYHDNVVCRVNWTLKRVELSNCGWNTSSTNRTLNDYKRYFEEHHPTFIVHDTRD